MLPSTWSGRRGEEAVAKVEDGARWNWWSNEIERERVYDFCYALGHLHIHFEVQVELGETVTPLA